MSAESNLEHLAWRSHPTAPGIPDPRCNCLALYQIQRPPPNRLRCHLDYLRPHCSQANLQCPKCFQECYPHHFQLEDSWLSWFGGYSIFEFILQGGPSQTKVVAKVIFLTIQMQLHHHVQWVTTMLWLSLPCPKCIPSQSSACFKCEIPSGSHVGFGCPATSSKCCEPWPFCADSFPSLLSSFPSGFLSPLFSIMGERWPKSWYWLEQTALPQPFCEWPRL